MNDNHRMTRREAEELRRRKQYRERISENEERELERRRYEMRKRLSNGQTRRHYESADHSIYESQYRQGSGYPNQERRTATRTNQERNRNNIDMVESHTGRRYNDYYDIKENDIRLDSHSAQITKDNRKKKKVLRIVLIVLLIIVILIAALFFYIKSKTDKVNFADDEEINISMDADGYTNIVLFGVDSREGEISDGVNSDTMIIASINNNTKGIRLVSVYRDTYMMQTNGYFGKANSAYCNRGAADAVNMLNQNLDLDIQYFMTVNFNALVSAIDILGGLDVDMTAEEVVWMNGYIAETSEATGVWSETLDDQIWDGDHHLNGIQATSYCRIRYTDGNDFRRTERQRYILTEMFNQLKKNPLKINAILDEVLPQVYTNMNSNDLIKMGLVLAKYKITDTSGFPYKYNPDWIDDEDQSHVVPVGLIENDRKLHEYLFPDKEYEPSKKVQEIHDDLIWVTGEDPAYYSE